MSFRENWERQEDERNQVAADDLRENSERYCRMAEDYLQRKEEYEATHQYADGYSPTHIDPTGWGFDIPLKIKRNGEFVRWPHYNSNPPGLYEVPERGGGYEYQVSSHYELFLTILGRNGYTSVEEFYRDYCGGQW